MSAAPRTAADLYPELRAHAQTRAERAAEVSRAAPNFTQLPEPKHYVDVVTPGPHSKQQAQIMAALSTPGVEEVWVACGTKFGKTLAAAVGLQRPYLAKTNALFRWVAPIYRQSAIGFRYMQKLLPPEPHIDVNNSHMHIKLPALESMLEFFHGQNAESIEGEAVDGYVLDECAKLKHGVYVSAKTTRTITKGPMLGISTPLGRNWFYRKCMQAKEEMEWAIARGQVPKKWFITAPTSANPFVDKAVIAQAMKDLPSRLFAQYYLADFIEDGGVFAFLNEAFGGAAVDYITDDYWIADATDSNEIYVGADWAKNVDFTVFIALNNRGELIGYKRFNRRSYPEQVGELYAFMGELVRHSIGGDPETGTRPPTVYCLHDKTGVGEAVDDIIAATEKGQYQIDGVVWTNSVKEAYVLSLILSLEQLRLRFHPIYKIREELTSFEVQTSLSGKPIYRAPEGQHDDVVMALVLANQLFRDRASDSPSGILVVNSLEQMLEHIHMSGANIHADMVG